MRLAPVRADPVVSRVLVADLVGVNGERTSRGRSSSILPSLLNGNKC
jgi:hypothetical protein